MEGPQGVSALRHRNFRLLWSGQLVAAVGNQMQVIAISWQVYQLTDSTVALGVLALLRLVPFLGLSLLGGALADAVDRRRLMGVTQAGQMTVALWLLATAGMVEEAWPIYLAALAGGALTAFDAPARQALIPNLVPPEDLAGALTLNTLVRQAATIVGPGLGGLSVAILGLEATYGINAASVLAVLWALHAMRGVRVMTPRSEGNLQRIAEGLRFARAEPLVLLPLLLDFVTRALGSPRGLLPVFARDVYQVGPAGLGWLAAASAVGAVAGGIGLTAAERLPRPIVLMLLAYLFEALLNAAFVASPNVVVAWVILCLGGVCNVTGEVLHATVTQLRTPDHLMGRTTALANMLAQGGPLTGNFQIGVLASAMGVNGAVVFNGLAAAAVTAGFGLLPGLRAWVRTSQLSELAVQGR